MSEGTPLLRVVLFEPEKAGNVGNVARTCAVLGADLHLIRPFGFHLHDREFRRAVMDYLEGVTLREHASWTAFQGTLEPGARVWAFSTHATELHTRAGFRRGDYLLFGPESRGLPPQVLETVPPAQRLRIPMRPDSRSLNLSNAVAVALFEGYRQLGYPGLA